jgi:hypothetical protein
VFADGGSYYNAYFTGGTVTLDGNNGSIIIIKVQGIISNIHIAAASSALTHAIIVIG